MNIRLAVLDIIHCSLLCLQLISIFIPKNIIKIDDKLHLKIFFVRYYDEHNHTATDCDFQDLIAEIIKVHEGIFIWKKNISIIMSSIVVVV